MSVDGTEAARILETLVRRELDGKALAIGARESIVVKAVRQVGEEYGLAMLPRLTRPMGLTKFARSALAYPVLASK